MRRHAAQPVSQARCPVDPNAGRRYSEPRPFARLDRGSVRPGRLCIAAEGSHCVAQRHAGDSIVGVDVYRPLKVHGRLGVQAPPGQGQAPPHGGGYVVGIHHGRAVVHLHGEPAVGALRHEQCIPPKHVRRRVRRINLGGPCVHHVGIPVAAVEQRQVPKLEVCERAVRIRPDGIPKGGLGLAGHPQVGQRMAGADVRPCILPPAVHVHAADGQGRLVRGARIVDSPGHVHDAALH